MPLMGLLLVWIWLRKVCLILMDFKKKKKKKTPKLKNNEKRPEKEKQYI